jgi:hypothetical protein
MSISLGRYVRITSMTSHHPVDVKTCLANAVRQYLLQKPNDRISEDEQLRVVCNRLAALLSEVLRTAGGWVDISGWTRSVLARRVVSQRASWSFRD